MSIPLTSPNVYHLLCDCKSLMAQAREVWVHHIYREANACANRLAKQESNQQEVLIIYDTCPTFVYLCKGYARPRN